MTRYADCPSTQIEVEVTAAPAELWPLVTDVNVPGRFSDEFVRAEWLDDGPALGARFRGFNQNDFMGAWDVLCTVTAFDEARVFEWTVGDTNNKTAQWRFELLPDGDKTVLRFYAEMGPGPSGMTSSIKANPDREEQMVERRLEMWRTNMKATTEGIRDLAEGG